MKKKYFRPKYNALCSIQFWRDKDGTLNCTETVNVGSIEDMSMYIHGRSVAKSKLLSSKDKYALAQFCLSFVDEWNKLSTKK